MQLRLARLADGGGVSSPTSSLTLHQLSRKSGHNLRSDVLKDASYGGGSQGLLQASHRTILTRATNEMHQKLHDP